MADFPAMLLMNGQSRILHVYYQNGHERLLVMDTDKHTVLYTVHRNTFKPHMSIYRSGMNGAPETLIGVASFEHFGSDIDVVMGNISVGMKKEGLLSSTYSFSAGQLGRWEWKRDGALTSNLKLIDHNGATIAHFENASWSLKKQGSFEIFGMIQALDLIIVTGLARVEYQRRSAKARSGANATINATQ